MKPHGRDCPDRCSQRLGASVKRAAISDGEVTIDGQPAGRAIDIEAEAAQRFYARKGGLARRKTRP